MPIQGHRYYFNQQTVDAAPVAPGVYGLYDHDGTVRYYGRSMQSIRSRLQSHLNGSEGPCTQRAVTCNWEITMNAVHREHQLLQEHLRAFGRYPICNQQG